MAQDCTGIVLVGAPATGKRGTAFALTSLSSRYARFPALTVARESDLDTVSTSQAHIDDLRAWAQVFHEITRDGVVLVYERERLNRIRDTGQLPVVTADSVAAMDAFDRESPGWLHIQLWRPPDPALLQQRGQSARAVDRIARGLGRVQERYTLSIRTDQVSSVAVAQVIHVIAQTVGARAPSSTQ